MARPLRLVELWTDNHLTRLIKMPKLHFLDSGLLAALLGVTEANLPARR